MLLDQHNTGVREITIILNERAGSFGDERISDQIRETFEKNGWHTHIRTCGKHAKPDRLAREAIAQGDRILIAAGGDGTISAVAGSVAGTDAVLGVLPMGTLNHFAKDLKIPLQLAAAMEVIQRGKIAHVDAAEVNGRIFVNNSSLGLYPSMVFERNLQSRTGRNKWIAMFWAGLTVLRRFRSVGAKLSMNGETVIRRTPFVFIGNNEYEVDGLSAGTRSSLQDGHLSLYIALPASRARLIWLSFLSLCGRLRTVKDFEMFRVEEVTIETRKRKLRISLDGEISKVQTPLHYRVLPGALRVFVP